MLKIKRVVALLIAAVLILPVCASDMPSLLQRDTWAFSAEETAELNAADVAELDTQILAIIAETTGNPPGGRLASVKVVDLNDDGVCEIIAGVDVSGRGLLRDAAVISRREGAYYRDTIPACGGVVDLWESEGKQLVVTPQPACEFARADPLVTYPRLYAWTGQACRDASRQARAYYEQTFLPLLEMSLQRTAEGDDAASDEEQRRASLRVVGAARAALAVNGIFEDALVPKGELESVELALDSLRSRSERDEDHEMSAVIDGVRAEVKAEILRLNNAGR